MNASVREARHHRSHRSSPTKVLFLPGFQWRRATGPHQSRIQALAACAAFAGAASARAAGALCTTMISPWQSCGMTR